MHSPSKYVGLYLPCFFHLHRQLTVESAVQRSNDPLPALTMSMDFMEKDELHQKKAYAYRYAAAITIPRSNFRLQKHDGIVVTDIRDQLKDISIEKSRFTVLKMIDDIPYKDYFHPVKVKIYFGQIEAILRMHLEALRVEVFRHAVRPFR